MELLQVRFHPLHPEIIASGSLDYEVRLWDASTSECIGSRDFCKFYWLSPSDTFCNSGCSFQLIIFFKLILLIVDLIATFLVTDRPIASIAFHAKGDILAVASGHKVLIFFLQLFFSSIMLKGFSFDPNFFYIYVRKPWFGISIIADKLNPVQLYIWQYNKRGEASHPNFILKTRRSLRAVHFHPHAAPFLLTAEVNYPKKFNWLFYFSIIYITLLDWYAGQWSWLFRFFFDTGNISRLPEISSSCCFCHKWSVWWLC